MAPNSIWLLIVATLLTTPLMARDILLDDPLPDPEYYEPETKWLESDVPVPQHINPDDLQEFTVAASETRFRYFLERDSIKHSSDGAVRFTLVIRSQSGATNSSYEGFRCRERLYKVYAYGGRDTLTPAPGMTWEAIPKDESTDYRAALYDDLLCNLQRGEPNPVDKVIKAMRNNKSVESDN
ncbi:MAG: CNP1-like family protein [Candidatus Thiodiazotropha sp. L084R]